MSALPPDFTLLQVAPRLEAGGAEQTTLDIAAAVVRAGGRAIVASAGGRMEGPLAASGAVLERLPMFAKNPLVMIANALALARVIRRERVSLVHVRSRAPAFSALWAARATGTPILATYHGVYGARSPIKRWYNAIMTRGDHVIANSAYTRDHVLAEHGADPDKVTAIPRGVDLSRFDPALVSPPRVAALAAAWGLDPDDRRLKLLLAGRLTRWKGQVVAIEALARLKAEGISDVVLLMAGDDQGRTGYRQELEALIAAKGLKDQALIVGHCADMPAAYALCDIALAPSTEPEAFGRTAVEPQAMGRPVIAAAHGAACETVAPGETGWLAAPGDPAALADAIGAALNAGPGRRAAMGAAAMARTRRLYSLDAMSAATLAVYAKVLARRSQGARPVPKDAPGASAATKAD